MCDRMFHYERERHALTGNRPNNWTTSHLINAAPKLVDMAIRARHVFDKGNNGMSVVKRQPSDLIVLAVFRLLSLISYS